MFSFFLFGGAHESTGRDRIVSSNSLPSPVPLRALVPSQHTIITTFELRDLRILANGLL